MSSPLSVPSLAGQTAQIGADAASTGMRIGTVIDYGSGAVSVRISGSDVLINAAYLSSYKAVVGDLVVVMREGSSWIVLGAINGSPNDNQAVNGSFEKSLIGAGDPLGWTTYFTGPAPTVSVDAPFQGMDIDGSQYLHLTVTGVSATNAYTYSQPFPVNPGEKWAARALVAGYSPNSALFPQAAIFFAYFANNIDTYPTTSAADSPFQLIPLLNFPSWNSVSTGQQTGTVVPINAVYSRVVIHSNLNATGAGNILDIFWDQVIVRKLS